jgi:UDP-N-acetylmuramoyl-L-alanyl-D-glutamate--2,6-diaminopimelate ligase
MARDGSPCCLSLRRLLPEATFVGCDDVEVAAATTDSQAIEPGQVFVAVRGAKSDGHQFVSDAAQRGASAIVAEQPLSDLKLPQCIVSDSRAAYALLCHGLEGHPAAHLKVIGITGTNGKSTTAFLVKSVLEAAGHKVGLIGTIEQFDGNTSIPAMLTTPGPDVLAKLMRRMVDAGCSHVVLEVSSHALDQRRVAGIAFDTAVFTNLTQDHLDYHKDIATYREAKSRLFRELQPTACAVLNADDSTSKVYRKICPAAKLGYAVRGVSDFSAVGVETSLDGSHFLIESRHGRCEIATPLVGSHNVYNCLAAAVVGRRIGLDWGTIRRGIAQVHGVPGRLESVNCGQPFHVFVDYAHTPDAVGSVLKSLRAIARGRVLCLLGAGGDRDRTKRPLMAQAAEAVADMIVITSDNPRTESPQRIISEIVAGFRRAHALAIEPDRRAAIEFVLSVAEPGDCVLLAGKGHENYQIIGTERQPFDDRLVAAECLVKLYPNTPSTSGTESCDDGAGTEERHPALPRRLIACGA